MDATGIPLESHSHVVGKSDSGTDKDLAHHMERHVTWKSAAVISMGGSILVAVSLGSMAADLGPASIFVWTLTAIVGVLQCLMICEMAGMFPDKSGGGSVYAYEGFKKWSPLPGAIASWGYWLGWIPVIPVNLVLVAGYLKGNILPNSVNVTYVAMIMAVFLYALNYFGLKPGVWTSVAMAILAMGPLTVIVLSPLVHHSLFSWSNILPFLPLKGAATKTGNLPGSWSSGASWMLMIKWMYIAGWSAYAFEAASPVIAEMKDPHKGAPKAIYAASLIGIFAYVLVPFMMLGICGVNTLTQDASVAFVPAAQAIFGKMGATVVIYMLVAALMLGAQTAIIGSSRTVYEMAKDGLMIKQFGHLNPFKVPDRGIYWDCSVTLLLLYIFKDNVINMVGASNVGYILVWIIMPVAFVKLRKYQAHIPRPYRLPDIFIPLAWIIAAFNLFCLIVGGVQWGGFGFSKDILEGPFMMGFIIMLTFIPFYAIRRWQDKQMPKPLPLPISAPMETPMVTPPEGAAEAI